MRKEYSKINSRESARSFAIAWQSWQSKRAMSYSEAVEWGGLLRETAKRYKLVSEFQENGII